MEESEEREERGYLGKYLVRSPLSLPFLLKIVISAPGPRHLQSSGERVKFYEVFIVLVLLVLVVQVPVILNVVVEV